LGNDKDLIMYYKIIDLGGMTKLFEIIDHNYYKIYSPLEFLIS